MSDALHGWVGRHQSLYSIERFHVQEPWPWFSACVSTSSKACRAWSQEPKCSMYPVRVDILFNQIVGSHSRHNLCKRSPIVLSHCVDQVMGSERHPYSDEDYCIFDPHSSYDGVGEDVCMWTTTSLLCFVHFCFDP